MNDPIPSRQPPAQISVVAISADPQFAQRLRQAGLFVQDRRTNRAGGGMKSTDILVLDGVDPDTAIVAVIDLRLSGFSGGVVVLERYRTSDGGVAMLEAGADHVLGSDVCPEELVARIAALHRRIESPRVSRLPADTVLPQHRKEPAPVWDISGIPLTERELGVLSVLTRNLDRVVTRHQLLREVWGFPPEARTNVVNMCISSIRRKLQMYGVPSMVHTVRGTGFILRS